MSRVATCYKHASEGSNNATYTLCSFEVVIVVSCFAEAAVLGFLIFNEIKNWNK